MEIKYKDLYSNNFVSEQELTALKHYSKGYYINNIVQKEEYYTDGVEVGIIIYNHSKQNRAALIADSLLAKQLWINIVEYEDFTAGYILETIFSYNNSGIAIGKLFTLRDANSDVIGYQYENADGNTDFSEVRKFYWDRRISPEKELFECTYNANTGSIAELYWNNEHIDWTGQESFALIDFPADAQEVIELTGMPESIMSYYLTGNVRPVF